MRRLLTMATLISLVVLAAACGDDDDAATGSTATTVTAAPSGATANPTPTSSTAASFPVTIQAANGPVTVPAVPAHIVSLSATATEMLFAIGAGPQVIAVDDQSTYPTEAPRTDLSGYTPNVEAIAAKDPDLVVVSNDINDVVRGLTTLAIPVLLLSAAATVDDSYTQMEQLGVATGQVAGAAAAVASMKQRMDAAAAGVTKPATPLTYYHELDTTYFSVTSKTFLGEIYSMAGLENIADPADKDASGYPQLSAEYIIEQDPDLIFLADTKCCGQNEAAVGQRPGWGALTAIRRHGVVELDDDIASRWGPRSPDLLEAVVAAVARVSGDATASVTASSAPASR